MIIPGEEAYGLDWMTIILDDVDDPGKGDVHVVPLNDCGEHEFKTTCPCHPVFDDEDGFWTHNSFDGREAFENGDRKLS